MDLLQRQCSGKGGLDPTPRNPPSALEGVRPRVCPQKLRARSCSWTREQSICQKEGCLQRPSPSVPDCEAGGVLPAQEAPWALCLLSLCVYNCTCVYPAGVYDRVACARVTKDAQEPTGRVLLLHGEAAGNSSHLRPTVLQAPTQATTGPRSQFGAQTLILQVPTNTGLYWGRSVPSTLGGAAVGTPLPLRPPLPLALSQVPSARPKPVQLASPGGEAGRTGWLSSVHQQAQGRTGTGQAHPWEGSDLMLPGQLPASVCRAPESALDCRSGPLSPGWMKGQDSAPFPG